MARSVEFRESNVVSLFNRRMHVKFLNNPKFSVIFRILLAMKQEGRHMRPYIVKSLRPINV